DVCSSDLRRQAHPQHPAQGRRHGGRRRRCHAAGRTRGTGAVDRGRVGLERGGPGAGARRLCGGACSPGATAARGRCLLRRGDGECRGPRPARQSPRAAAAAGEAPGRGGGAGAAVDLKAGRAAAAVKGSCTLRRYPAAMPALPRAALLLLFAMAGGAHAASISSVEIVGLDEEMEENVRTSLSLVDAIGSDVTWRRLAYMMRAAGDETREALEPFGYYAPRIVVERVRDGDRRVVLDTAAQEEQDAADSAAATAQVVREAGAARAAAQAPVQVVITVEPGEPVRVRRADIAILGDGHDDRYLQDELDDFVPRQGSILDH